MFGYVIINHSLLKPQEATRFRACYCGLCRTLGKRYGAPGRLTLSNDMTFLTLLLASLYEPAETCYDMRCALHPAKKRACVISAATLYAADMNILLAYHKCLDDQADERSPRAALGARALRKAYDAVARAWPRQCDTARDSLLELRAMEKDGTEDIDALARLCGRMLGETFAWKDDVFAPALRDAGTALGRFIYLMDAWEDYDRDVKRGAFNPLRALRAQSDYEERVEDILTMEIARCARAVEFLPLEQDAALINNILYSGVWGKYASLRQKRKEAKE